MKLKAREFALAAHGDQQYGDFPYVAHLDEVAHIARPYGENAEVLAYLHDVIEDTNVSAQEIAAVFGHHVSSCVQILSDEPGESRKVRKAATYRKMASVEGEQCLALLVKAADRLANMRASKRTNDDRFLNLYRSEYELFRASVYRENLCEDIWAELESLQHS